MSLTTRNLKETLTLWANTGSDGFGGFTFAAPVTLNGRWEDLQVMFKTPENEEVVSSSVVYTGVDVAVGDYIAQTDLTATSDPTTISDTWRIRQRAKVSDLRGLQMVRKAFL